MLVSIWGGPYTKRRRRFWGRPLRCVPGRLWGQEIKACRAQLFAGSRGRDPHAKGELGFSTLQV